ncbi:MAG: GGDEF domain-containing protein [Clostridiaceae bacterium]|nr:GGDEF domain-containing protein [Clostridiaceae bacterium]
MNFDNLSQAVESVHQFRNFFQIIRIWSKQPEKLIYESRDEDTSEILSVDALVFRDVTLSVNGDTLEANLAVTIDGQPCGIELIRRNIKEKDSGFLQSMQELIITDPLTNLYNRRFIDEQLPRELNRAFQNDEPVSFLYADIDLFKQINDRYGHIAGDCVLKDVASIFQQQIRRKDGWIARYGGDEFLLCLPAINQKAAAQMANRIRNAIAQKDFRGKSKVIRVSCSFGVRTLYRSDGANTLTQIIGILDKKLYEAKAAGGNKVII